MNTDTLADNNLVNGMRSVGDLDFDRSDRSVAGRYVTIGYVVTLLFLGSAFAWAALAPISSAAIAPGVLGNDGYRKTVQHLEGGIVDKILVRDGDEVEVGQVLIELADVQSQSDYSLLQKQILLATAKQASLLASQNGEKSVALPDGLLAEATDPAVREAVEGQIQATLLANQLHDEQQLIIAKQIDQARAKIAALRQERGVLQRNLELVQQELTEYEDMQARGLVTRQAVFDLKRQLAEKEADYSANRVALQSTAQEANELEMKQSTLQSEHINSIGEELDRIREELVQLEEKRSKSQDTVERTLIRAPTAGVVINLQVNTIGGVIRAGQPLLDIVPSSGKLVIEAKINPLDRDTVAVGQQAEIRFSAFNRRVTKPVEGRVTLISADGLLDELSGESYYRATVELLEDPAEVIGGGQVYPGMQAEVFILTGSRTALSYLVDPVAKSFNRAFREE